ncbi:LysR family transcriptional regulator [Yoonia sp. R2331]|uniref:LysR family transcriptional regulator n=1 Tax=Yoonia sp. R2331 TaxID=3237238 RepID=UPI0034E4AE20
MVYFAAIAEAGSIRGAAARLNLSVPVLSEALSDLEAELGVTLATRTTRSFKLTHVGQRTQRAAQDILDRAKGLSDLTATDRPLQGRLSLTVPVEIAGFWLPRMLSGFRAKHPEVVFDIDVTDSVVDLRASKIEVAIRTEYVAPAQESQSRVNLPLVVVSGGSAVVDPNGVVNIPLIDSRADRKLLATSRHDGSILPLTFFQSHQITNRAAGLQMARSGLGAIMVMRGSVSADLESGDLVEILPNYDFGSIDLKCHFRDRLPSPIARVFAREMGLSSL